MFQGLLFCGLLLIAYIIGYAKAHSDVSTECKRLGKFYVNDDVFECVKISKKEDSE